MTIEMHAGASAGGVTEDTHGWIWSALPIDCDRAEVQGAPGLARLLAQAGFASSDGDESARAPADVLIVCGPRLPSNRGVQRALAELGTDGALVVACSAGADEVDGRRHRLARRVAIPGRLALLPARRRLRAEGLTVWLAEPGAGRAPALVAARRRRVTVTEGVAQAVEPVLGHALGIARARVLSTGTLMCELAAGDGSRYLLRLAAGPAAVFAAHGRAMQARLVAAAPGSAVTDRLVPTLAAGKLRGLEYTVEPFFEGASPRSLTTDIFDECIDFLATLARAPGPGGQGADELVLTEAATLLGHLDAARAATLTRVAETLAIRLGKTATIWCHGDFWPGNLLVRDGRLVAVLDWDAATSDGLPVLDLLHAIATGDGRFRRLSHGRRCVDGLWPLARAAADDRVRRYCERIGMTSEPVLLEALAVAYWLGRVARDVRMFADRTESRTWMQLNVEQPLDALAAAGW